MGTRARDARKTAEGLLGRLEYEVLSVLWRSAPAGVPRVLALVNERRPHDQQLAYTTIMTVLGRLHDKGVLERERRGRGYDYTPRFSEVELIEHLSRREVTDLMERYGEIALAQFVAAVDRADPGLVERLRDLGRPQDA